MGTIQRAIHGIQFDATVRKSTLVQRFFNWCEGQEKNRLGWLAGILTGHGCFITPLVLLVVVSTGNNFIYWPLIIAAMGMCLVTNLAAMPTRVTIPVFFLSLLIDLGIVISCVAVAMGA